MKTKSQHTAYNETLSEDLNDP